MVNRGKSPDLTAERLNQKAFSSVRKPSDAPNVLEVLSINVAKCIEPCSAIIRYFSSGEDFPSSQT
jgi:hypothetical protein